MRHLIPIYEPTIGREEFENVIEALESGWISSKGEFIYKFEENFAKYLGVKYGIACSNGTAALHLALESLKITSGDEVIVPTLSFVATANAVTFTGAKPVFVDSNPTYWCIDPESLEKSVGKSTKAIIPVHLYGHPCDMEKIMGLASEKGIYVIEDAAESHGSVCHGKKTGAFGDVSCFSFYGNKIITTGEGGMCLTNSEELAEKMRLLRDHGMRPEKKYWHEFVAFNYRMTNLQAALGVAQLKKINQFITNKRRIANWYREELQDLEIEGKLTLQLEMAWAKSVYWMNALLIEKGFGIGRDEVLKRLGDGSIEARPFFYPIHKFPMYNTTTKCPIAEELSRKGINLPSSAHLRKEDVENVTACLRGISNREFW